MAKKKKNKTSKRSTSSLQDHQRKGKRLEPPFIANFGDTLQLVEWARDLLPEYLWIAALFHMHPFNEAITLYNQTLDILDPLNTDEQHVLLGTVSSFALVPEESRSTARNALHSVSQKAIIEPVGLIFSLYPECPATWLMEGNPLAHGSEHLEGTLGRLKYLIKSLMPAGEHSVTKIRGVKLNRLFKHNKILLNSTIPSELIEGIEQYPNTPHQSLVDSFIRNSTMAFLPQGPGYGKWSQYFWQQNYRISICTIENKENSIPQDSSADECLGKLVVEGVSCWSNVKKEVTTAAQRIDCDLFNPDRDDVLLGLLGRQARLLSYLLQYDQLWLETVGMLLLRSMIDCLITLTWLAQKGVHQDFRKFKEYSLGKEKLLKLHLEERLDKGAEELAAAQRQGEAIIANELNEEFLSIELGHWLQRDTRKMADDVGLGEEYRLLYAPLSASAHGEWLALKQDVLVRCANPLHRGHYILDLSDPSGWSGFPYRAAHIFEKTYGAWARAYKQPETMPAIERYLNAMTEHFGRTLSQ
jgi:hypothetical protein